MDEVTNTVKKTKAVNQVDRVAIGKNESDKIGAWILQMQSMSKGFLKLTKSDIINFLIREHKADLNSKEIAQIRSDNYDPIRHMNWITQELKTALSKNDFITVATLQDEIKGIELSANSEANEISKTNMNNNADQSANSSSRKCKKSKKNIHKIDVESLPIEDLQKTLVDA